MRNFFRYGISGMWAIAFILFALTLETVADELGYTKKIRVVAAEGWTAVDSAGYSSWVFAVFIFLTGAMIAAWVEYGLRKMELRKRNENWAHLAIEMIGDHSHERVKIGINTYQILDGLARQYKHRSDPKTSRHTMSIVIVFEKDICDPHAYVHADRPIIWREIKANDRVFVLDFDFLANEDFAMSVIIRPAKWLGVEKDNKPLKWDDATVLTKEQVLG
jgi:hypothetical protein